MYKVIITYKSTGKSGVRVQWLKDGQGVTGPRDFSHSSITASGVLAAETESASGSSVTLTVDTVDATESLFLSKPIYKSNGTFFGICTKVNSTTEIVFAGGLDNDITDNDNLYTSSDSPSTNFVSGTLDTSSGAWQIAELKPDSASESRNIKSIRLWFWDNAAVPADFAINDISIIYRLKSVK